MPYRITVKRMFMKIEDISNIRDIINAAYREVNDMVSFKGIEMVDLIYPSHDGEQDADAASSMMLLRQDANGLARACEMLVQRITDAIGASCNL